MTFEAAFFGPGNRIRWDAIRAGSLGEEMKTRLAPFLDEIGKSPDVLVLPRVHEDDGRVQWYVLCSSSRVSRIARDELRAFLGPSYSDFEGRPTILDPNDGVEAAVITRCGKNAFRIEVPQGELINAARERLLLRLHLLDERPARTARKIRAVGRVLRDYEYALQVHNPHTASECIAELRSTGQLGAINLLFLEVRRLASVRDWSAILALPEFGALLAMRRPRRVTDSIIRALYAIGLREFEDGFRAQDALEYFRSEIYPKYSDLFRTHAGLSGYEVDASFLLAAAAAETPRLELAQKILEFYPEDSPLRPYIAALAALMPVPTVPRFSSNPLVEAKKAFAEADVDRAYDLTVGLPTSFDVCALLLRCARDMGTLSAARAALNAADQLSYSDKRRLIEHAVLGRVYEVLSELAVPSGGYAPVGRSRDLEADLPSSWSLWLRRLLTEDPWRSAVSVAEIAAREWSIETLLSNPDVVNETAELILADRPSWGQTALRDALPYLLEFFLSRGADPRLKAVYENLFLAIAIDDQVSLPQIAALLRAAEARIALGVSVVDYREIVRQLTTTLDAAESPSIAGLALETLDILVTETCPDPRERENFVVRVASLFKRWYRRIDDAQWALLQQLAEEIGMAEALSQRPTDENAVSMGSIWTALDKKRIALYSLRETALRRVQLILVELCPGARVEWFSDSVGGSMALRTAATNADVFVLATAAAKHAATIYIEANRLKSQVTLYARGQGSASMLEVIREFLLHRPGTKSRSILKES